MRWNTNGYAPPALDLLDSDQDIRIGPPPCVSKRQNVLQKLALLLVCRILEGILVALEVERSAFILTQKHIQLSRVHSCLILSRIPLGRNPAGRFRSPGLGPMGREMPISTQIH